jgi:hypothetical protein
MRSLVRGSQKGQYYVLMGWSVTNGIKVIVQLEMGECAQAHEDR